MQIPFEFQLNRMEINDGALTGWKLTKVGPSSSSFIWQLSCWVALILLGHDYAADAVPLYQYTCTHFANLGRMTG